MEVSYPSYTVHVLLPAAHAHRFFPLVVLKPNFVSLQAGSISRADVADFILGAVTQKDFPYVKQAPCISSVGGTSWVKDRSGAARGEMA